MVYSGSGEEKVQADPKPSYFTWKQRSAQRMRAQRGSHKPNLGQFSIKNKDGNGGSDLRIHSYAQKQGKSEDNN